MEGQKHLVDLKVILYTDMSPGRIRPESAQIVLHGIKDLPVPLPGISKAQVMQVLLRAIAHAVPSRRQMLRCLRPLNVMESRPDSEKLLAAKEAAPDDADLKVHQASREKCRGQVVGA